MEAVTLRIKWHWKNTIYSLIYFEKTSDSQIIPEENEEDTGEETQIDDEEEEINEYDLTLYIREEDGRFQRFEETHFQKCYEIATIKRLLQEAGLEFVAVYDAYTKEPATEECEKVLFIARERGKSAT